MRDYKKERARRRKKFEEEYKPAYDALMELYPFTLENLPGEVWKVIPNYENYHGSNYGRVKRFYKNGKEIILKPLLSGDGYLYVALSKNGKQKNFRISRLVGKLFIPNSLNKPEVNHVYSRFSNHVDCLEWTTSEENTKHAFTTGLRKSGEDDWHAKLTNEQVLYIRENPEGLNTVQLAEIFPVTQETISDIQLGKKYKDAGGKIREKKQGCPPRIPVDERTQILADYQAGGISMSALAKKYNRSIATIWKIVNGK